MTTQRHRVRGRTSRLVALSLLVALAAPIAVEARGAPDAGATTGDVVPAAPVTLVAAGDIAACSSNGDAATAALLDSIPGEILLLGDNVYESGTLTEFNNCYGPNWGQEKARTHPAPGNHEYGTSNASGYFSYFGAAAGQQGKGYYSYDYGSWHIIVLNTGNCGVVACAAGSVQEQWLRSDLASHPNQCTLAAWHHPRFSSGTHGNNNSPQPFFQALYDYGADVVLSGHDHVYERFAPQTATGVADASYGVRQFTVGSGGRNHHPWGSIRPNSQSRNNDAFGVLRLELDAAGYSWQFVPEAGKTFSDTGSGVCHGAPGPPDQPPVFSTDITDRTDAEGASVSLDADATDADLDPLTYSATNLPGGISINSSTGVISGTLNGTSAGTYNVTITVSDGTLADTDPFTWTVTDPNGVVYVDDTFGRTLTDSWGSAPTGGAYTIQNPAANYDVTGGFGTISLPSNGATRQALLNATNASAVDFSFRLRTDKVSVGGSQYLYGVVRRNGANEYRVKVRLAPGGGVFVSASTVVNNVEALIGSEVQVAGLSYAANSVIRFRAEVTGASPTTLRIRAWADAATEPTTWNYTATNSNAALQGAGSLGLRLYTNATNAPLLLGFDDLRVASPGTTGPPDQPPVFSTDITDRTDAEGASVSLDADATDADLDPLTYSATNLPGGISINSSTGVISGTLNGTSAGTYNVTITVSDGTLADTDPFTWTVTDPNGVVYVDDTFGRTLTDSWGSAPTGGAYTIQNPAANYDVTGGFGTISLPSNGATRQALLNATNASAVDFSFRLRTDKVSVGGSQYLYGVVRRNGANEYRVKVRLAPGGGVFVSASTVVNNVEALIGSEVQVAGLSYAANSVIRFRAEVTGASPTTLRIRAWADAATEPTTWNYTATNSNAALQGAGSLGLRLYTNATNAPLLLGFDDLRVASPGS